MTMPIDDNPFKAPAARVQDFSAVAAGELIPDGQRVPAGSVTGWIGGGWALFKQAPGTWIGIGVAFMAIIMLLSVIPLINIVANLIMPILIAGIMIGCKAQEDGEGLAFSHLFAGFSNNAGSLVLVGVLYLVGVFAVALVMGLLAAVFIGGAAAMSGGEGFSGAMVLPMVLLGLVGFALFFPLAMAVWYAPALVVFHDVPAFNAMKMSFFACLKNFVPFLVYGLIVLVLGLLASLPLLLGWLVLMPVLWGSMYASYRAMFVR